MKPNTYGRYFLDLRCIALNSQQKYTYRSQILSVIKYFFFLSFFDHFRKLFRLYTLPTYMIFFFPILKSFYLFFVLYFLHFLCFLTECNTHNNLTIIVEDVMEEFRHNGRDFEYCPDLDNVTMPETTPRRKKNKKPLPTECVFCRNNGEEEAYYRKHLLKDADGRVSCPVLR